MISSNPTSEDASRSREPLNVLTLTPFYPVRGDDAQGCFVAEPLAELARLGVSNTVRAVQPFYRGQGAAGEAAIPAQRASFFSLPGGWGLSSSGAFLFASLLPEIRRQYELHQVHVIHAHSALPCGHAASLLSQELKIPFVVTVHGLDAFSTRQVGGRAGKWCAHVSQSVYRSAWSVICVSRKVEDQVIDGAGAPVKTTVIYNGVDPERFYPPHSEPDTPVILSVGNLIASKGHEVLLRAFATLQNEFPVLSLEIIGDGPERLRLEKLATDLGIAGRVHFRARQSRTQVADAMRHATVFALPSRYEGLGCVYLEAMSSGKPVVGCNGQGIEEVIEPGINGCLVAGDNIQELAGTLARLLQQTDLRRKMGEAARRSVLQGFTLEHQTKRLLRLYQECRL